MRPPEFESLTARLDRYRIRLSYRVRQMLKNKLSVRKVAEKPSVWRPWPKFKQKAKKFAASICQAIDNKDRFAFRITVKRQQPELI